MHIVIRRWFDGHNTYYSARVNGELFTAFSYGYGDHGLRETLKALGFKNLIEYREAGHTYELVDVRRKRDL